MALGERKDPSDFLLGDEEAEAGAAAHAPLPNATAETPGDLPTGLDRLSYLAQGSAVSEQVSRYSTNEAYLEQLQVGSTTGPTDEVRLESYSTNQAYLDQLGVGASEVVEVEALTSYTPADEFLELLEASPSDRRAAARVQRILAAGMLDPTATPIVIIDVSLTGLRLGCVDPLERGTLLQLEIPLQPLPLRVAGQVCWCRQHVSGNYEVGLRLAPLTGEALETYRAFVEGPG